MVWRSFVLKQWFGTARTVNLRNSSASMHNEPNLQLKVDFKCGKPLKYTARIQAYGVESVSYNMDTAEEALEDARVRVAMLASTLISKAGIPDVEQEKSIKDPLG